MYRSHRKSGLAVLVAAGITVAACGPAGASPSEPVATGTPIPSAPTADPSGAASPVPSASIDPLAPYPSRSGELQTVRIAQSIPALSLSPLLIAQEMNFFGYQGIDLELISLESGSTAFQAVVGGSVDVAVSSSTDMPTAVEEGLELVAVQQNVKMTFEVCVRRDWVEEHEVDVDSSLEEKVAALEGSTIGTTGPGAASDRVMRWLVEKYGGLQPDTDVRLVSIGGASARISALDSDQIQVFLQSPSGCSQTESGMALIGPSDVPEWQEYVNQVAYGLNDWLTSDPEVTSAMVTALSMGNNFILKYPDAALEHLTGIFDQVDPELLERDFRDTILPQVPEDGRMTQEGWDSAISMLVEAGLIESEVDTEEGGFWTNEYIGDASVR